MRCVSCVANADIEHELWCVYKKRIAIRLLTFHVEPSALAASSAVTCSEVKFSVLSV